MVQLLENVSAMPQSMPAPLSFVALFLHLSGREMCLCLHRLLALVQENSRLSVKLYLFQEGVFFVGNDVAIFAYL